MSSIGDDNIANGNNLETEQNHSVEESLRCNLLEYVAWVVTPVSNSGESKKFGGELELVAAAKVYQRPITVHQPFGNFGWDSRTYGDDSATNGTSLPLLYTQWDNRGEKMGHYESLISRSGMSASGVEGICTMSQRV